jgi:hypothetical protein
LPKRPISGWKCRLRWAPKGGLLGVFAQPELGTGTTDPQLEGVNTGGGVTSVQVAAGGNLSSAGGPITSTGTITISLTANPSFTSLTVGTTKFVGYSSSTADPSTTELPADKNWGFHENTTSGNFYLAINDGGVIKKALLS